MLTEVQWMNSNQKKSTWQLVTLNYDFCDRERNQCKRSGSYEKKKKKEEWCPRVSTEGHLWSWNNTQNQANAHPVFVVLSELVHSLLDDRTAMLHWHCWQRLCHAACHDVSHDVIRHASPEILATKLGLRVLLTYVISILCKEQENTKQLGFKPLKKKELSVLTLDPAMASLIPPTLVCAPSIFSLFLEYQTFQAVQC